MSESISSRAIKPEGKASAEQAPPEVPPTAVTPGKKAPAVKIPPEQALLEQIPMEQTLAEHAPLEKPPVGMASQFSGPFFGKASMSDLKKPEIHEANPKYPFSIQLGAFRTLVEAQNAASVYREKGISSYWSEVDLEGNERWFRVHTGFFETREAAGKYEEEQNLVRSIVKETPHSTLIGIYRDKDELETKTLLLTDLGYMPYAIEDQDKKYRLFVGAFITKQGAEEQRRILETKDIQSQVIKR